jgi:hypothetical protein
VSIGLPFPFIAVPAVAKGPHKCVAAMEPVVPI